MLAATSATTGSVSDQRSELRQRSRDLSREQVECGMTLAGFAVFRCPLKEDTHAAIQQILDSGHRVLRSCSQIFACLLMS